MDGWRVLSAVCCLSLEVGRRLRTIPSPPAKATFWPKKGRAREQNRAQTLATPCLSLAYYGAFAFLPEDKITVNLK